MKYTETRIYTTSQGAEPVMALLMSHGIENISVDDPQDIRELIMTKDNKDWDFINPKLIKGEDEAVITIYTEHTSQDEKLLQQIKLDLMKLKSEEMYGSFGENADFGRMYVESVPLDDDWKDRWKEGIKPFKITESIVIKPTWENYEMNIDELVIEIDPGMAFGTGSHETTKSCATFLEKVIKNGDSVLDIGTGSGILSIVAEKCGASKVDAYEIDSVAVEVAKKNIELNNIENGINVIEADILKEQINDKYDIIVSNLTSGIIIKMLPQVKKSFKDNGHIILSGMLYEEKPKMVKAFEENNLSVKDEIIDGEWYTVLI